MRIHNPTAELDRLIATMPGFEGEAFPGVSWAQFATWAQANRAEILPRWQAARAVKPTVEPPLVAAPPSDDYEAWTEKARREANLNAAEASEHPQILAYFLTPNFRRMSSMRHQWVRAD